MSKKITFYAIQLFPLLIIVLLSGCQYLTKNGVDTNLPNNDPDDLVGLLPPVGDDLVGGYYPTDDISSLIIGYMSVSIADEIIYGGVTEEGKENMHAVYYYENRVITPTDPLTGAITGSRRHYPSQLIIEASQGTPKLYEALSTGRTLTIQLDLYTVNALGENTHAYTITYETVQLINVQFNQPNTLGNEQYDLIPLVSLEFVFGRITITHIETNSTYTDNWGSTSR